MEAIKSVKELYKEFIRDIYHAEVLLVPELRFFAEQATSDSLKTTIKNHLSNTRSHISRLEEIQDNFGINMMEEHCRTMKSMIVETKELVDRCSDEKVAERAVVASLHRITHCMVTVYQMLISMADELDISSQKEILENLLRDEVDFDKQISAYGFSILWKEFNITKKMS